MRLIFGALCSRRSRLSDAWFGFLMVAAFTVPAPASAGVVEVRPGSTIEEPPGIDPMESCARYGLCELPPTLVMRADPGEANALEIRREGDLVVFTDTGAVLRAGSGCTRRDTGAVACPFLVLTVETGDGDDTVAFTPGIGGAVLAGPGDDRVTGSASADGGAGADVLTGTEGRDRLEGGDGADRVAGLGGDDTVIEPSTAEGDTLDGGAGLDTISFAARLSPVVIQFGSMTQEAGSAGEGNVVGGFESAEGGSSDDFMTLEVLDRPPGTVLLASGGPGDDRITTGAGADHVSPGPGDDVVSTGGGSDQVSSSSGEDRLAGGAGADVLAGGAGRDVVTGGAGADRIGGGSAADVLRGGAGRDVLVSRDRVRDSVDCGSGSTDRAVADRRDRVRRCERVRT